MLRRYGKFRVLTYGIYLFFLFIDFFLFIYSILSVDQFWIYLFALMGVYVVIDSMMKTKTDSILKRHQIPFTVSLVLAMVLLASFFITSSINSTLSLIILISITSSLALFFRFMDWNNKRKTKQTPS